MEDPGRPVGSLDRLKTAGCLLIDDTRPESQLRAAKEARRLGVPVVADVERISEAIREVLAYVDYAIASGESMRDLGVGGVGALWAEEAGVLAVFGEVDKLVGVAAAHGARVGEDGDGGEGAALENAGVGVVHLAIGDVEAVEVGVEGVEVLHGELAEADEAAAGSQFVAELLLDLVDEDGKVAVGVDVALEELDDDLLVGGAEDELAVALVGEAEEDVAHGLVTGSLPDLDGVDGGHHELLAVGGVHLFADDAFDVAEGAPGEGEEGVDAGGDLVDEAGAEEEREPENGDAAAG